MSIPCEAGCGRRFNAIGSMHKHLIQSTKCSGYVDGKLRDIGLLDDDIETFRQDLQELDDEDEEYEPYEFEPLNYRFDEFHFNPPDEVDESENEDDEDEGPIAGPGPSTAANLLRRHAVEQGHRVFDDESDPRVTIWTEHAGRIIRRVTPPVHVSTDVTDEQGDVEMADSDNPFFPFSSELDWKIAQWAIKDRPGHNTFDRLLNIPGVCFK